MEMSNPSDKTLPAELITKMLPALSLLAEDIGEKVSVTTASLNEILLSIGEKGDEEATNEVKLWGEILAQVKETDTDAKKDNAISQLRSRGIPEFPARLAVYVATNQCSKGVLESTADQPSEPFHRLLPDHGWHNDLSWDQLPTWIKSNPKLMASLKGGEQVVGKNVRYKFVANKLIRRLRDRVPVASSAPPTSPSRSHHFIDNTQLLMNLVANKKIRIHDGRILKQSPAPLPNAFSFDKVEGMLLGIAIGDALGATSEGLKPSERRKIYGEIVDYRTDRIHHRPKGVGTDDTQMSFWTIEQLIDDYGLVPESLAKKFCKHPIWGMGKTVGKFVENFSKKQLPWYQAGTESLGNGALMRIAPILLPYLRNPHSSMYADAAIATMLTHNDFANNATSVAFIDMLWQLLSMDVPPNPEWWIDTYCSTTKELEGNTNYQRNIGTIGEYSGPLWRFASSACKDALKNKLSVEEACKRWGSGANLFETVPSILYILATHGDNLEESIIRAVNDTKDNDSVAAVVGAAVGALHGLRGIPTRWVKHLKGRIREGHGQQVFRLLVSSKQAFWFNDPG